MIHGGDPTPNRGRRLAIVALCQIAGGVVMIGSAFLASHQLNITVPWPVVLLAAGLLAAALGHRAGLPAWWLPLQALFPLAAAAGFWLEMPAWVYLAGFLLLLSLQWNAARGGVPLYLTNRRTHEALARLLPDRPGLVVADLGSGFGGTLLALARARSDANFVGIETAPLPFAVSWLRLFLSGLSGRLSFVYGDYHRQDLSAFDVVYCFLSPVPMPEVYAKARCEMRPGTLLISNSFTVPDHAADDVVEVADWRRTRLYVWHL